eukprot:scaffold220607_cov19-Tisochrysis_lutea.AAC.1
MHKGMRHAQGGTPSPKFWASSTSNKPCMAFLSREHWEGTVPKGFHGGTATLSAQTMFHTEPNASDSLQERQMLNRSIDGAQPEAYREDCSPTCPITLLSPHLVPLLYVHPMDRYASAATLHDWTRQRQHSCNLHLNPAQIALKSSDFMFIPAHLHGQG